jgi:hypothetical protein
MAEPFFGWHTIYGVDGEHAAPYMTRIWAGRLRLHIFYRGDNDPDPHDHPWDFWTFPLTSYVEEVTTRGWVDVGVIGYQSHLKVVRAFRLHHRPATYCHRVLGRALIAVYGSQDGNIFEVLPAAVPGRIITVVWRGKGERKWGFLRNRDGKWCWTPWREYVFGGGKHAPCEPTATEGSTDA